MCLYDVLSAECKFAVNVLSYAPLKNTDRTGLVCSSICVMRFVRVCVCVFFCKICSRGYSVVELRQYDMHVLVMPLS